jgi:hypothetical protein
MLHEVILIEFFELFFNRERWYDMLVESSVLFFNEEKRRGLR